MIKKNIATFAVDVITEMGSDTVFSLTGGMAMYINNAVHSKKKLTKVYCQHEQACVAAAEGFSKAHNFKKAGFAVITAGPGVSNSITSLLSAYGDSTPMFILAGQIKSEDIDTLGTRTHGIQEINSRDLITPCVKQFIRISKKNYKNELINGISNAFMGRPGPIFFEIPLDVQGTPIRYTQTEVGNIYKKIKCKIKAENSIGKFQIKQLVDAFKALSQATRPLVYIGNGCRISNTNLEVIKFIEENKIPAVFSWLSFDAVPAKHTLNFGCPGGLAPIYSNKILSSADVIIFLGARLDLGTTAFQPSFFGINAKKFYIDVDPAELRKLKNIKNATLINANLKDILPFLLKFKGSPNNTSNWLSECILLKKEYESEEVIRLKNKQLSTYKVAECISKISKNKIVIPASSGYAEETFSRFFKPKLNCRFFNGAALGSMGLGLPHAIGASFASKNQVICIEADGGIMLNIQELATYKCTDKKNLILIILNNHGYESIRSSQNRIFKEIYGADLKSGLFIPDFQKISKAFGLKYLQINTIAKLNKLGDNYSHISGPILIDIHISQQEYRGPSVKTIINSNGKLSTTPLSEITW